MAPSEALEQIALTRNDVADALALSSAAGWNQTADDWALFVDAGEAVGLRTPSARLVASAATMIYSGGLGWISMVLVTPAFRHRGLATLLMEACVRRLQAANIVPVLDATPAGEPVYRRLGFRAGFALERWEGTAPDASLAPAAGADVRTADATSLDAMAALDEIASGIGRRALLQDFLARRGTRAWIAGDRSGFVLARAGTRATQLGPLVAADAGGAIALLSTALAATRGLVFLDVPKRWAELTAWLERLAFVRQRPYVRMSLGARAPLACGDRMFVLAGPEFG